MTNRSLPVVNVAVAVVQHSDGRVLLAERPKGKVSGGFWEFPGGKFEFAEDARRALTRELHEEVGIELDAAYPWMTYDHAYDDKVVRLHVFRVLSWHGTPHGREGQRIAWEDPAAVTVAPLLPANSRVLHALSLPPVYAITQAGKYGVSAFMLRLVAALEAGVRLIQVREPRMTTEQLAQFARRVMALAHRYQARVLVNGDFAAARRAGADGVHLQADQLMRLRTPPAGFWAASCHSPEELARAVGLGANFVVVSQVLPTASHPGRAGLGWDRFAALTRDCPVPVYALGGMRFDLLDTAMRHGAHGIAVQSEVW
ncbi:MAG: Nudix family hydrolase [Gammaproteobacteria bacterium]